MVARREHGHCARRYLKPSATSLRSFAVLTAPEMARYCRNISTECAPSADNLRSDMPRSGAKLHILVMRMPPTGFVHIGLAFHISISDICFQVGPPCFILSAIFSFISSFLEQHMLLIGFFHLMFSHFYAMLRLLSARADAFCRHASEMSISFDDWFRAALFLDILCLSTELSRKLHTFADAKMP